MSTPTEVVTAIYAVVADRNLVELYNDEEWTAASAAAFGYLVDEDFEFVLVRGAAVADQTYRGAAGFFTGMRAWLSEWSHYTIEVEQLVEHGDAVAALTIERAISRSRGVPVSQRGVVIYRFEGEQIGRCETYLNRAEGIFALTGETEAAAGELASHTDAKPGRPD